MLRRALLSLALVLSVVSTAEAGDGKLAIRAGKIITLAGDDIENGVIVMDNGRITAIGTDIEVPWDIPVIDATDMVAFPGLIEAHTNSGMDRPNENIDVAPFLSVKDSVDPVNQYFENAVRWGITTLNVQHGANCVVGAQGMVVKPSGITIEEMMVKPRAGLKICLSPKSRKSRSTQAQLLRKSFSDLERYLQGLVQQKKDGDDTARREALFQGRDLEGENAKGKAMGGSAWTVEGLELVPRGEIEEKSEPLLHLVEGKLDAWLYCQMPMDVARAVEIAKANGFLERSVFVVENSCWKAADALAATGRPVVLRGGQVHTERDYLTGEEVETFVPAIFEAKGISYALSSVNATTESLIYQAALAVGLGLERGKALAAVTHSPAKMLGLGDRLGSLEVGKDGNVVLFSGDPLSVTSSVEHVVIEGSHRYDRSKDPRLKLLRDGRDAQGVPASQAQTDEEDPADVEDKSGVDEDDSKKQ